MRVQRRGRSLVGFQRELRMRVGGRTIASEPVWVQRVVSHLIAPECYAYCGCTHNRSRVTTFELKGINEI